MINAISMEQVPLRKRRTWRLRSSLVRPSITTPSGTTLFASAMLPPLKACTVSSMISPMDSEKTFSSSRALSEKCWLLCRISSRLSQSITAWSVIRSKSLMQWSKMDSVRLSSGDSTRLFNLIRYDPNTSTYRSTRPSRVRTFSAFSAE